MFGEAPTVGGLVSSRLSEAGGVGGAVISLMSVFQDSEVRGVCGSAHARARRRVRRLRQERVEALDFRTPWDHHFLWGQLPKSTMSTVSGRSGLLPWAERRPSSCGPLGMAV